MKRADLADVIVMRCGMDLPKGQEVLTQKDLVQRGAAAGSTLDKATVSQVVNRKYRWGRVYPSVVRFWSAALALDPGLIWMALQVSAGEAPAWVPDLVRVNVRRWTPEDDLAFQSGGQDLVFPQNPAAVTRGEVGDARTHTARVLRPQGTEMPPPRSSGETPAKPEFLSQSGD